MLISTVKRWSFFALLLMGAAVTVPTINQWVQHDSAGMNLVEVCTDQGVVMVPVSSVDEALAPHSDEHKGGHHQGNDCPYCNKLVAKCGLYLKPNFYQALAQSLLLMAYGPLPKVRLAWVQLPARAPPLLIS